MGFLQRIPDCILQGIYRVYGGQLHELFYKVFRSVFCWLFHVFYRVFLRGVFYKVFRYSLQKSVTK